MRRLLVTLSAAGMIMGVMTGCGSFAGVSLDAGGDSQARDSTLENEMLLVKEPVIFNGAIGAIEPTTLGSPNLPGNRFVQTKNPEEIDRLVSLNRSVLVGRQVLRPEPIVAPGDNSDKASLSAAVDREVVAVITWNVDQVESDGQVFKMDWIHIYDRNGDLLQATNQQVGGGFVAGGPISESVVESPEIVERAATDR